MVGELPGIKPAFVRGAFIQLVNGVGGMKPPNVVVFQVNPEKLSRTLEPYDPSAVDEAQRGAQAPTVQPFAPKETYSFELRFDATDDLERSEPMAVTDGISDRLAAVKKLAMATDGLGADLVGVAKQLSGDAARFARRPSVAVVLFSWGPGRLLPVRITQISFEETQFNAALAPTRADVSVTLQVLTPDVFHCQNDPVSRIAIAAYRATRLREDSLAVANIVHQLDGLKTLVPLPI